MNRDSIYYFPAGASTPCKIGFFAEPGQPARKVAWETVELSSRRACVGRNYFKAPGGIQYGRYFMNVQFTGSAVKVPFGIMTKEELREDRTTWKELQKQIKEQAQQEKQGD